MSRLTLEEAEYIVRFAEMMNIFWKNWEQFTEVDDDALEFLVANSSKIILPNVMVFSEYQLSLLKGYQGFLKLNEGIKI